MYLDEFSNIIYPGFKELVNKAREANVGLIYGHQAIGDLEICGPEIMSIITSNSNNKIFLKNTTQAAVDYIAKELGTRTIERPVESFSTKDGITTPAGFTKRQEDEFVIKPDDLRDILMGQGVVRIDTLYGRLIKKIKFPNFKEILGE